MNKERIDKLVSGILEVSKSLGSSLDRVEDKLVEGVGRDLKNTIKIMEVLEKFNHLRMGNIMTINKVSRAKRLIQVVDEEMTMYRLEGKKAGEKEWSLIFRSNDLAIVDSAADRYRDKYASVRVAQETPDGPKPIKGRNEDAPPGKVG